MNYFPMENEYMVHNQVYCVYAVSDVAHPTSENLLELCPTQINE